MDKSLPSFIKRECDRTAADSASARPFFLRVIAWLAAAAWGMCTDWRAKRSLLIRATAHLSIITLALLVAILFSGVGIPVPQAAVGGSFGDDVSSAAMSNSAAPQATPSPTSSPSTVDTSNADAVVRQPVSHTTIPNRPRADVITYTIRSGDTVFSIATRFGLAPETIVWSNRETIQDAPWLIQPGLELLIPPTDGAIHPVRSGETVDGIADEYGVKSSALYNKWNDLEEDGKLREGQLLVIPDGQGDEVTWKPPEPEYATGPSRYSYGICQGVSYTGPGSSGNFILPTGSTRVSGWYFHDPRNPTHIGLDYACNLGDPIYASDNGVVTIAGWNGGYGILVELSHGNGYITRYAHLSQLAVGCGQPVYQGNLIGYCGSTGWSTGSHLHFEIRDNGVPRNPQTYLP